MFASALRRVSANSFRLGGHFGGVGFPLATKKAHKLFSHKLPVPPFVPGTVPRTNQVCPRDKPGEIGLPLCRIRRKPGFVPGFHRICTRDKPSSPGQTGGSWTYVKRSCWEGHIPLQLRCCRTIWPALREGQVSRSNGKSWNFSGSPPLSGCSSKAIFLYILFISVSPRHTCLTNNFGERFRAPCIPKSLSGPSKNLLGTRQGS